MVVKRVNVTLEDDLHETATNYADGRGWSFSGLVSRALKDFMERGDSSPSSPGQAVLSEAAMNEMISAKVEDALRDFMTPEKSDALFERLVSKLPAVALAGGASQPMDRTPVRKTPGLREGKVSIPDDLRERLQRYGASEIEHATGGIVSKGTAHGIIKKNARGTSPEFLEALTEAIERLEKTTTIQAE